MNNQDRVIENITNYINEETQKIKSSAKMLMATEEDKIKLDVFNDITQIILNTIR